MELTPSQTVGPFFAMGLPGRERLVADDDPGAIVVAGTVRDGAAEPVPDALIEIWQADPAGRYRQDVSGFGRCATDAEGRYAFVTVKPGPVEGQAPHISVLVLARGLLRQLCTRVYFPDEAEANGADPLLAALGDRRETLVARPDGGRLVFDIHLQGVRETVFLDV